MRARDTQLRHPVEIRAIALPSPLNFSSAPSSVASNTLINKQVN